MAEEKAPARDDRYLRLCVKIINFRDELEKKHTNTRDDREKEGIRVAISEVYRRFRKEMRYGLKRVE